MSFSENVLYCPEYGKVEEYPICCGKESLKGVLT
jgi:hypothetical protein